MLSDPSVTFNSLAASTICVGVDRCSLQTVGALQFASEPSGRDMSIFAADRLCTSSVHPTVAPTRSLWQKGINPVLGNTKDSTHTSCTNHQGSATGGSSTSQIKTDAILGNIDKHFLGNSENEEGLLTCRRQSGCNTTEKVQPFALADESSDLGGTQQSQGKSPAGMAPEGDAVHSCLDSEFDLLTVMTFNIWGGGANEGKPVDETVAAILAADADIIGVQETRLESDPCTAESCPAIGESVAQEIAEALGFYYYDQTQVNNALWANAIISRYPIETATEHDLGVAIDMPGHTVYAYNIHLTDFPYQPYQLLDIEYGDAPFLDTATEAVQAAQAARGDAVNLLLEDLAAADDADAVFIFGDFNEPSHRDWTEAAVAAGLQPLAVRWPTTLAIEAQGFVDVLRAVFPDEVAKPAFTWTPTSEPTDPEDHHDRIDFVFARGEGLVVKDAYVVGEKSPEADIVVSPWPSDHRAIAATVMLPE